MKNRIISIILAFLFIAAALATAVGAEVSSSDVFEDVKDKHWFKKSVDYVLNNGLMNGMTDTTFAPNTNMSRGMLVTVLWRYEGSPAGFANNFKDVPAKKYYTDAVCWAGENGVVNGVADRVFNPNGDITREQLATIFYRYTEYMGCDVSNTTSITSFPDYASVSKWATAAMKWACAEEIITGTKDGHGRTILDPKGKATRAQVATVLMRYCSNDLHSHNWDEGVKMSDPTCTEKGEIVYTCLDCYIEKHVVISALGHIKTNESVVRDPTCTEKGVLSFYCTRCEDWWEEPIDELGHSYGAATCTKPKTCTRCGATSGSALGHKWKDATCTAPKTCSRCGATSGKALGHKYDSGKVTKEATCTATGVKTYTCTRCGHKHDETIKAKGHKTDAPKCSRCGHNNRADLVNGIRDYVSERSNPITLYSDDESDTLLGFEKGTGILMYQLKHYGGEYVYTFSIYIDDKDTINYQCYFESGSTSNFGISGQDNMKRSIITKDTDMLNYNNSFGGVSSDTITIIREIAATDIKIFLNDINYFLDGSGWTVHTLGYTNYNK